MGVIGVAGTAGLVGSVPEAGTFLTALDGLDRDVDVEDPLRIPKAMTGLIEVAAQPVPVLVGLDAIQGATPAVLADDRLQAEQARGDVVAA